MGEEYWFPPIAEFHNNKEDEERMTKIKHTNIFNIKRHNWNVLNLDWAASTSSIPWQSWAVLGERIIITIYILKFLEWWTRMVSEYKRPQIELISKMIKFIFSKEDIVIQ